MQAVRRAARGVEQRGHLIEYGRGGPPYEPGVDVAGRVTVERGRAVGQDAAEPGQFVDQADEGARAGGQAGGAVGGGVEDGAQLGRRGGGLVGSGTALDGARRAGPAPQEGRVGAQLLGGRTADPGGG